MDNRIILSLLFSFTLLNTCFLNASKILPIHAENQQITNRQEILPLGLPLDNEQEENEAEHEQNRFDLNYLIFAQRGFFEQQNQRPQQPPVGFQILRRNNNRRPDEQ